MTRNSIEQVIGFTLLVVAAVSARLWFRDIPNFAPVAAVALFAGYVFKSRVLAIAVPLTTLVISDFLIGGYETVVMIAVYSSLTAPVLLRGFLRRHVRFDGRNARWSEFGKLTCCALGASVLFFVVTNLAVWATWYQANPVMFGPCYAQALPFFRFTLLGDLAFATTLFGGYAFCANFLPERARIAALLK